MQHLLCTARNTTDNHAEIWDKLEEEYLMTEEKQLEKAQSIGEYLRKQREIKSLELEEVAEVTKIPLKTLRAIEGDNFAALPADAFARGFYILYARHLGLDTQEIVKRYLQEKGKTSPVNYDTPMNLEKQVNVMAARPSLEIGSALGFFLILLIMIIAALCYYFSWNPATYLSEKLRSLQNPDAVEQPLLETTTSTAPETPPSADMTVQSKYVLTVDFLEETTATISIDDSFPEKQTFPKNTARSWFAKDSLTLILPEAAKVHLLLNGSELVLPEAHEGFITLRIP